MSIGDIIAILELLPAWLPVDWLVFGILIWFIAFRIARLSMQHPRHKKLVAGWLRYPRYTQLYRWACRPVIEWFWQRIGETSINEKAPWITQAKGAFSAMLYSHAMLLSVIYPIIAAFTYWLWSGNAATIGSAEILGAEPSQKRLLSLGFAILIYFVWLKQHALANPREPGRKFAGLQKFHITFLTSAFFAFALANAIAFALAGAVVAGAIAFTVAIALFAMLEDARVPVGAYAISFASAFAGIVAGTVTISDSLVVVGAVIVFYIAFTVAIFIAGAFPLKTPTGAIARGIAFAFLFILTTAFAATIADADADADAITFVGVGGAIAISVAGFFFTYFLYLVIMTFSEVLKPRVFYRLHGLSLCTFVCGLA